MTMTRHAAARCQQRGVPRLVVDLLLEFVSEQAAPGGARKYFFDKPARRRLSAYAGTLSRVLEDHLDVYAVVADGTTVVTIGHRTERIARQ